MTYELLKRTRTSRQAGRFGKGVSRWPLSATLLGAVLLGGALAGLAYWWLTSHLSMDAAKGLTSAQLLTASLAVPAAIGAIVALTVNIRKQDLAERTAALAQESAFTDRFRAAATQLGSDAPAERIAGVYAMAALADDYPHRRQECIDVLCGYIRLPYDPDPDLDAIAATSTTRTTKGKSTTTSPARRPHDTQVRDTIIVVIRSHTQDPKASNAWCSLDFDFRGVRLHNVNLGGSTFSGANGITFEGAAFSGSMASFEGATFSGETTEFSDATFTARVVSFAGATFLGEQTGFSGAKFLGEIVSFVEAKFLGEATEFDKAKFLGEDTWFSGAKFLGEATSFAGAKFLGGATSFVKATFSGKATSFDKAKFTAGVVSFDGAKFTAGVVSFAGAKPSGRESFRRTRFLGDVIRNEEGWPPADAPSEGAGDPATAT